MTIDTSIGLDPRQIPQREDGSGIESDAPRPDTTREDIEAGNDRNVSADQGNRSGRTNKLDDDGIELGGA